MFRTRTHLPLALALAATVLLGPACGTSVNDPIDVPDGQTRAGGFATVNGSITIGKDCVVRGTCKSVNGHVEIGRGSRVDGVSTVNGAIDCDRDVTIEGDVESVNGSVSLDVGGRVGGDVQTVNGTVDLVGASVASDVRTVNGNVRLAAGSTIAGRVVIEDNRGTTRREPLEIVLDGGSVIEGGVFVRDPDTRVRVVLRDAASAVRGPIDGAEVVREGS